MPKRARSGLCECGCGGETKIATYSAPWADIQKGQPLRFIRGHENRRSAVDYVTEDRGYETPCWIWQMSTGRCGYGVTRRGAGRNKSQGAHRYYYTLLRGPIPDGLDIHHRCGVRLCVNPDHMEPISTADHLRHHSPLTAEDVREIRRRYVPRRVTRAMLAEEFGTTVRNIAHIVNRTTWVEESA